MTSRDVFHHAVNVIYGAALEPTRWPDALQAMADVFGDAGTILLYGRDDGAFGVISSPSLDQCVADYTNSWSHRDTRANRSRERGYFIGRDVITDRDVVTPSEMNIDPFYSEFLTKYDLRYFAAAMVSPDRHVEVALSFQRQLARTEYSEDELATVSQLGVHVEKALRLGMRLMDSELINEGLGAALTHLGIGVFALDSLGRIVFSNPAGQKLLGDGLDAVDGRLLVRASAESVRMDTAIKNAISYDGANAGSNPNAILIERQQARHPLAVYLLPIPNSDSDSKLFLSHARAIALVIDPDAGAPPDPTLVRDLLGLTLSEARLASLIGTGLAPREAAARLSVSEETARTVLKRVFAKLGSSRQSELAALMARLMLR